ncbi:hypothetical protein BHE74_00023005, partial [Ensete ventricosum]
RRASQRSTSLPSSNPLIHLPHLRSKKKDTTEDETHYKGKNEARKRRRRRRIDPKSSSFVALDGNTQGSSHLLPALAPGSWLVEGLDEVDARFRRVALVGLVILAAVSVSRSEFTVFHGEGLEGSFNYEERKERRSEVENSEDERRRTRIGSLKKKALNASTRFTHSLRKRGSRVDFRVLPLSIEDVRDAEEERAVYSFRQQLIAKKLLPNKHDDYHTLLRLE